jgi:hypothetical protein
MWMNLSKKFASSQIFESQNLSLKKGVNNTMSPLSTDFFHLIFIGLSIDMKSKGSFEDLFKKYLTSKLNAKYNPDYSALARDETFMLSLPVIWMIIIYAIKDLLVPTIPISNKGLEFFLKYKCEMMRQLFEVKSNDITTQQKNSCAKNMLI